MLDLDAIEARAEYKLAHFEGQGISLRDITWTLQDVLNLLAELRAAREVVEAAVDLAERDGHKDDLCDDCGLGGHTSPCPWQSLDTSLAAYRAVVGEQG